MNEIDDKLIDEIKKILSEIKLDFGGGCSLVKAYMMAWLIVNFNLKITVDIGVYRGRSLFPQAIAHKMFTKGIVYGIDPWDKELARETDNEELRQAIDDFIDNTDFKAIGSEVRRLNQEKGFSPHCNIIQGRSEDAINMFIERNITLKLIHIDGNHDTDMVTKDVKLYTPLLAKKGFIILDDISWNSIRPAYNIINSRYALVFEKKDVLNDYAIFWDNAINEELAMLKSNLLYISDTIKE